MFRGLHLDIRYKQSVGIEWWEKKMRFCATMLWIARLLRHEVHYILRAATTQDSCIVHMRCLDSVIVVPESGVTF